MTAMTQIKKYLLSFLILVFGGYLLLVLAYCLPTGMISKNVEEAAWAFMDEGAYRQLNFGGGNREIYSFMESLLWGGNSTQDNYTDSIMLLSAEHTGDENPFVEAMKVKRTTVKGQSSPVAALVALHTGEDAQYGTTSYARYWHGYLIFLKPLLLFFSYQQIRYFLSLAQLGLVSAVVCLLAAKGKGMYCAPVVLAYFFINPAACSLSLQYTPVLVLTMAELAVILLREERYARDKRLWLYHFFVAGCLTSYFDLLTYPLVTLGIPVIFLVSQYEGSGREGLMELIGSSILWGTGYASMWAAKWALGSLITGNNVLKDAVEHIFVRAGSQVEDLGVSQFGRLEAVRRNLVANRFCLLMILVIFAVCLAVSLYRDTFRFREEHLPIALGGLLPFGWYLVVSNHSIDHAWMTFRELSVFVFALITIGVMLLDRPQPVPEGKGRAEKGKGRKK